jgi:membrane associated rhomboid family serine protease
VTTPSPGRPDQPRSRAQQRRYELAHASAWRGLKPGTPAGAAVFTLAALAVLWFLVGLDDLLDHRMLQAGIKPRQVSGLVGIIVSPFLHADARQLATNTIPFAALAWLLLMTGVRQFLLATVAVLLASGVVDWVAGPSHEVLLGVSGVVFGWLGYLLARAWFSRNIKWIAVAVIVAVLFSSLFSGLLPKSGHHVFWGGHVAGLVVGALVAALLHRKPSRSPKAAKPAKPARA